MVKSLLKNMMENDGKISNKALSSYKRPGTKNPNAWEKKRMEEQAAASKQKESDADLPKTDCNFEPGAFVKTKCKNCGLSVWRHKNVPEVKEGVGGPKKDEADSPMTDCPFAPGRFPNKCATCNLPKARHKNIPGEPKAGAAAAQGGGGKEEKVPPGGKTDCAFVPQKFQTQKCQTCGYLQKYHSKSAQSNDDVQYISDEDDEVTYGDILAHCCGGASVAFAVEFMLEPFFEEEEDEEEEDEEEEE